MSDQPDQAAAMRQAVEEQDLDRIKEAYEQLAETDLNTLLEQIAAAIDQERYEDAETIFQEIMKKYQTERNNEKELSAQINAARTSQNSSFDTVQELTSYLREANRTRVQRTELLSVVSTFLDNQLENTTASESSTLAVQADSSSEVIDVISRTQDKEDEFADVTESATQLASTVSLPPTLKLSQVSVESSQIKTAESVPLTVTVTNVGDDFATDITVSVEPPESVKIDTSRIILPDLSANDSISKSFTITPESAGSHAITISVDSAESFASLTETITATSEITIPEEYQPYVNNDGVVTESGLNDAIRSYLQDDLQSRYLNGIIRSYLTEEPVTSSEV
ncbi:MULTISPECIES: CARDB domain-containing protein [Halolamina]|uniref:CARDB protein n=2 Tax=Halolamina TaxID=1075397 RepID=A0A1I5VTD0_9EURY|nr:MULTISPECIES: CARDB domain-containing protein [Halolamina]NHX37855.1 hypothetical protein [Halolamina sp. R1-12]SFQ10720.1 CARDB protein [Halolamina pelagica]